LKSFLACLEDRDLMRLALGIEMDGAPALARSAKLVCFDCEEWTGGSKPLTEIGVCEFSCADTAPLLKAPGPHAEAIFKQIRFRHYRMKKYAHLVNQKWVFGNPDTNIFGQTTFITEKEAKNAMEDHFHELIDPSKPELGFRPVLVLGHAIKGDLKMLQSAIDFDLGGCDTTVAFIDTQRIAMGLGLEGKGGRRNLIGLENLCMLMDVPYKHGHTALNDAAFTMFSGIKMAIGTLSETGKTSQEVFDNVARLSNHQNNPYGVKVYCVKCAKTGHSAKDC
ncbi:hypothetical protein P280DRAFT_375991, partial [Massarina eburnea CBS 473.64]